MIHGFFKLNVRSPSSVVCRNCELNRQVQFNSCYDAETGFYFFRRSVPLIKKNKQGRQDSLSVRISRDSVYFSTPPRFSPHIIGVEGMQEIVRKPDKLDELRSVTVILPKCIRVARYLPFAYCQHLTIIGSTAYVYLGILST